MAERQARTEADLAALADEKDHLLRSLDDLDAELAAGDLDQADYVALKDDYTARAAEVLRAIDAHNNPVETGGSRESRRAIGWVVGLTALAIGAGFLLAQAVGERGVNDQITGSIDPSDRDQVLRCQQMGAQANQLLESLTCFDEVLDRDPQNVEALTYRGWYVVLASGTAQQAGQDDAAAELLESGMFFLDRAIEVDSEYPDARAFRAIVFDRNGQPDRACEEIAVIAAGSPPPMIEQLVAPLAERLEC